MKKFEPILHPSNASLPPNFPNFHIIKKNEKNEKKSLTCHNVVVYKEATPQIYAS